MKYQLIFGLSLLFFFTQCNTKSNKLSNTATVSGKIINPKGAIVSFMIGEETITDSLNQNNEFSTAINLEKAQDVIFKHGEEVTYIYLKPGYSLSLSLDTEAFDETLTYTGEGAGINNFKASMVLREDTVLNLLDLTKLPEDSFLVALNNKYASNTQVLKGFSITDKEFLKYYKENNKWNYILDLMEYESYHSYHIKEAFEVSKDYYAFQDTLDFDDASNLDYNNFLPVIQAIITEDVRENMADEGPKSVNEYIAASVRLFETYKNDTVKERLYFEAINKFFNRIPEEMMDTVIRDWKKVNPPLNHIAKIEEKFAKWEKIKKGLPAPDFKYVSMEGDSLTMADFLGKVVYIDVWATWCGPCIAEHPHMEKLQAAFKDEEVVFLAISIDETPEPWKKMVEKKQLGGVHLYADGAWRSDIIDQYMINGIPRFILIDQAGKIVNADAARPSGNIAEEIEKLL